MNSRQNERLLGADGLQHIGYQSQRVVFGSNRMERIFSFAWLEENRQVRWMLNRLMDNDDFGPATQRDARVAATVVQWLGSNVGLSFVIRCLRQAGYTVQEPRPDRDLT